MPARNAGDDAGYVCISPGGRGRTACSTTPTIQWIAAGRRREGNRPVLLSHGLPVFQCSASGGRSRDHTPIIRVGTFDRAESTLVAVSGWAESANVPVRSNVAETAQGWQYALARSSATTRSWR